MWGKLKSHSYHFQWDWHFTLLFAIYQSMEIYKGENRICLCLSQWLSNSKYQSVRSFVRRSPTRKPLLLSVSGGVQDIHSYLLDATEPFWQIMRSLCCSSQEIHPLSLREVPLMSTRFFTIPNEFSSSSALAISFKFFSWFIVDRRHCCRRRRRYSCCCRHVFYYFFIVVVFVVINIVVVVIVFLIIFFIDVIVVFLRHHLRLLLRRRRLHRRQLRLWFLSGDAV